MIFYLATETYGSVMNFSFLCTNKSEQERWKTKKNILRVLDLFTLQSYQTNEVGDKMPLRITTYNSSIHYFN